MFSRWRAFKYDLSRTFPEPTVICKGIKKADQYKKSPLIILSKKGEYGVPYWLDPETDRQFKIPDHIKNISKIVDGFNEVLVFHSKVNMDAVLDHYECYDYLSVLSYDGTAKMRFMLRYFESCSKAGRHKYSLRPTLGYSHKVFGVCNNLVDVSVEEHSRMTNSFCYDGFQVLLPESENKDDIPEVAPSNAKQQEQKAKEQERRNEIKAEPSCSPPKKVQRKKRSAKKRRRKSRYKRHG